MEAQPQKRKSPEVLFSNLISTMAKLRGKNGCPWDRKQTHQSIARYLLEEAYESFEAIREKKWQNLKEELGDLLFQVIFHSHLAEEAKRFTIDQVLQTVQEKLIARHPHVFGNEKIRTAQEQTEKWDEYKIKENKKSLLERVPKSMPALLQAFELQERAQRSGFKWKTTRGVIKKFKEELLEWDQAVKSRKKKAMQEELGDVLFMMTNLARWLNLNAEEALLSANARFRQRFTRLEKMLRQNKRKINQCSEKELELLWRQTKRSK